MPIRKNNPNDRRAAQTPPPRTGTADSGYHDNDGDDAARPQPRRAERVWDFNGAGPFRQFVRDPNDRERDVAHATELARRTAEAREESRRQLAEEARVQRERQAALQRAVDQRILAEQEATRRQRANDEERRAIAETTRLAQDALRAEQDAARKRRENEAEQQALAESARLADEEERQAIAESARLADEEAIRRIEDEEERQAIAESTRVAEEEAAQRQEDMDIAIAISNSAAEAYEAERLRAAEAALEARRSRAQKEFEDRQRAANLRAAQAAQLALQQESQRKELEARVAQAAQEAERRRLQEEAARAVLQQEAEARQRKERAAQAAEAARKRQEEAERKRAAEQRASDEAAADLQKEQEDLDFALALSLEEFHEEVEVDNRSQHALPISESGAALQLLQEFKRLQDSVEQREAAAILASEQRDEASPITRVGDQAEIGIRKTQLPSSSQDGDDTDELFFDAPELVVDENLVRRHLANAGEDWSDRAVMNSPLLAPMPRPIPFPTRLEHPFQPNSASVHEEDTRLTRPHLPESELRGPGSPFCEPIRPCRQPEIVPASPPHLDQLQDVSHPPNPNTASRVVTNDNSINRPINIYGNVTINNEIHVNVPVEKTRSLLKRAIGQSMDKARGRAPGMATLTNAARDQTGQIASLIRSGVETAMENLNIGGNRYVTNADRALRVIDEGYETPSLTGSPSPDPRLMADLEAVQERLRTPPAQLVRPNRPDDNGSPVSLAPQPLRVVNTSPTPNSLTPVGTGVRPAVSSRSSSSLYASPSTANPSSSSQLSASDSSEFNDSGVGSSDARQSPTGATPSPHPTVENPPRGIPAVTRKPVPDNFNRPSRNPSAPAREPSASSMRVENDSPAYMTRMLGRKRVHPPVNTEWANVPAATQDLAFTNSHAMMGANRFDDSRHEMPTLPQRTGDAAAPVIDRTITPNTKAKKTEKDAQKKLRGLM